MEKKFSVFLCVLVCCSVNAQISTKSYFCAEIYSFAGGQRISQVPTNQANVVWWWDNGEVTLSDGTRWKKRGADNQGNTHYRFASSMGTQMPCTVYNELIINNDKTLIQMKYSFGLGGMMMPMVSIYRYLGEGTSPAEEWGKNDCQ